MAIFMKSKAKGSAKGTAAKAVQGSGKGKTFGKGGGGWVFVPQNVLASQKGAGKAAFVSRKGGGKGKGGKHSAETSKFMDKLAKIDASKKVWVGGMSTTTTWKTLEKHFTESCGVKPGVTEVMPKGRACLAFKTEEDASAAIASVNATELDGKTIEVDVWTQKEKTDKPERAAKKAQKQTVIKTAFAKTRGDPRLKEKMKSIDSDLKVFVGGLDKEINAGYLRKHFVDAGCRPHLTDLTGKDRACLCFKTADEAQTAIDTLNGTTLEGSTLEVDAWTKPEKKEKTA